MQYDFDKSLGKITQQISRALGKRFEEKCRANGLFVNAEQWTLLSMLHHKGPGNQRDIGKALYMDKVAVTRVVKKLHEDGLLHKEVSATDKRENLISLTSQGERFYLQLEPRAIETIADALDGLDQQDISQVFSLLNRIRFNLIPQKSKSPIQDKNRPRLPNSR